MTGTNSESRGISSRQETLFEATLEQLKNLGYRGDLLQRCYSFGDWFAPETPLREAPAAAFGRTPAAYDSACFALLLSNGKSGKDLIVDYRALGAPLAFEVREDCVIQWKVGRSRETTEECLRIFPDMLDRIFRKNESSWHAQAVLRAKNIGFDLGPRQIDFIDLGLIPALESQIREKLDRLLREVVQEALRDQRETAGAPPDLQLLFRLIFRTLAAKVLHDRRVSGFTELPDPVNSHLALKRVAEYYNDPHPLFQNKSTQTLVADKLWSQADFQNLSVEVLAYIYENTLVDESVRMQLGTHSTPHNVARYILHHLPVEEIPADQRFVLEPCCGHAIFLVSALQRLREILPGDLGPRERHRYFVKMLEGYEVDAFALEVAKMCLMLADFPNHNGWKLNNDDVFASKDFILSLKRARIVVCNPPFEDFNNTERARYPDLHSVKKPVEVLHRTLENIPADAMIGFVLPQSFVDGAGYREIRKLLAERYCDIELVSLPDRVFAHSAAETVLLIGKHPSGSKNDRSSITFTEVQDQDREKFLRFFAYTRRDAGTLTLERAANSLAVTALGEIWDRLAEYPKLGTFDIHRGVEWQSPFDPDKYISTRPKPGFKRGIGSAAGHLYAYLAPPTEYLCVKPECRKGGAFDLPWDDPKVVMNAVRVSRGPWRIAAFADESGLLFSQSFTCLWPSNGWTAKSLAAVLNGPVVNAFIATHEKKHVRKKTLARAPLPRLSPLDMETLDRLVDQFVKFASTNESWSAERSREILINIDAQVLRGYNLPPRMERQILEFFRDRTRPVPFDFGDYYPQTFSPYIPLWMYISKDLEGCTARRWAQGTPEITDPALVTVLEEVE
jgi:type I restriction-modification system DNA methylase subunit